MKKVIVGVAMLAVLLYLATRRERGEGMIYAGPHCADQLINCKRGDVTGRVCEECIYMDGKFKTPYGLPDPNFVFQGQKSAAAGGEAAIGCQVVPGESVDKYIARVGVRTALGAKGDECGWGQGVCYGTCRMNHPDPGVTNHTETTSPWNNVSGTCRVWGVLWKQGQGGGGIVNECKNGFTPTVRSAEYMERRGAGAEAETDAHQWNSYLCACEMSGATYNTLVNEKTADPNVERQRNYTFDYSKVDPIPEIDKGLTIAGNITRSQAYHQCGSWDCGWDTCPWGDSDSAWDWYQCPNGTRQRSARKC